MKAAKKMWLLALIFALAAAVLFYRYLIILQTQYEPRNLRTVVVAKQAIEKDTIIGPEDVELRKIPQQYAHPMALHKLEDAVGKVAVGDILVGEQIVKSRILTGDNQREQMSHTVPADKRAISVAVDQVTGVAGFLRAGDKVDVLATVDTRDTGSSAAGAGRTYTVLALQDIQVLAVGTSLDTLPVDDKAKNAAVENKTITLAVTPRQGQILTLASERGTIRIMLRSPVDRTVKPLSPLELNELVRSQAGQAPAE